MAAPIDHLDVVAREPMIVEHPDGTLFVAGFGAPRMGQQPTNVPTLWKSRDGGTTWARVNVGAEGDGAIGNSDVDLAVSPDGTLYFVNLLFDEKTREGKQVHIGVSKDTGATWKWTRLSETRFDDRPWVKVAPDGTAHVVWNDGAGVCYAVSRDDGLTWTERDRIHPQGGSSHLAVGPDGELAARVMPYAASGNKYDEGIDLIAVSTDGGMTWRKHEAPGTREWSSSEPSELPRWVEPLAWDARGALYSFWTNMNGRWLARSTDRGATWTSWHLAEDGDTAFYPYLVARGDGQLAATWFSHRGQAETLRAHVCRIDLEEGNAPPRMAESRPFELDCYSPGRSPDDLPVRGTGGEYLAALFLKKGGLAVVSPIQNMRDKRFGFSFWKLEERRGEAAKEAPVKDQSQPNAAKSEMLYSESPGAWYEVASNAAQISSDGKWALYHHLPFSRGIKLINLETGREDAERLAAGMDRVFNAAFYMGSRLARLGERAGQRGWYHPDADGVQQLALASNAVPQWSPDGSHVAYFLRQQPDNGLFVGDAQQQKPFPVDGEITGFAWSPDGRLIYVLARREDGSSSLVRIKPENGSIETLVKDLDAEFWSSPLSVSADGRRLYVALASPAAPVAEARHQPDADRDLDIYELELSTGARRAVAREPGDDFSPCVADGFLYWTHNYIRESVVVIPSSGGAARVVVDEAELPYWSPDGKQMAFTYGGWRLADWALNLDAGVVAVDSQAQRTSKMKPIVMGYHEDFTPAWSPDGKWIAYHSHRSAAPVSSYEAAGSTDDLYLRRVAGGPDEEIRLTDFGWEDGVADWSPDGRRLVFDSYDRGGTPGVSKPWIVTIDPSNGTPLSVERLPLPDPIKNANWESWSPKGDEIAFEERTAGGGCILWVIGADGKRAEKLVEYKSSTYGGLDWTPDGKTIVYGALAGERMQIFAVPRSGGAPRQLTDDPANLMHPQVSPDGCWIACTRMDQTKEIRRLKL